MRVAFVPRSTEIQPLFWRFVHNKYHPPPLSSFPYNSKFEGLTLSWEFLVRGESESNLDEGEGRRGRGREVHTIVYSLNEGREGGRE